MSMVPDKVPRKVMGGGFRSHSPPRSKTGQAKDQAFAGMVTGKGQQLRPHTAQGSVQPSSRKTPTQTPRRDETEIEKEYIQNLQQQIYFLELELKYSKENQQAQQEQQPPQGSLSQPSMDKDAPADEDATLALLVSALKKKVSQMQKKHDEDVDQLQKKQVDLMVQVRMHKDRLMHVESECKRKMEAAAEAELKASIRAEDSRLQALQSTNQSNVDQTELKLIASEVESLTVARDRAVRKYLETVDKLEMRETDLEYAEASLKMKDEKLREAEAAASRLRLQVTYLEEELQKGAQGIGAEEAKALKAKVALQTKELDHERLIISKLREELESAQLAVKQEVEKVAELQLQLINQEADKGTSNVERIQKTGPTSDAEVLLKRANDEIASLKRAIEAKDSIEAGLRHELSRKSARVAQLESDKKVHALMRENMAQALKNAEMALGPAQMAQTKLTIEANGLLKQLEEAEKEKEALERAHAPCATEIHRLKTKLEMCKVSEVLSQSDLGSLMEANQQVSANIKALVDSLNSVRP